MTRTFLVWANIGSIVASSDQSGSQTRVASGFKAQLSGNFSDSEKPYTLDWVAQGTSFFDGWNFDIEDANHGAAHYLDKKTAVAVGVVHADESHVVIRTGPLSDYKYKRQSAKISTNRSWTYFLAAMKFSHVPYGCGVWPAFFTLGVGESWPHAGELDILEYVNSGLSKSSFHCSKPCTLNAQAVNKFGWMPDRNNMNYDCVTAYPKKLGCAPNKWVMSGEAWGNSPGVLAVERTKTHVKVFYIREREIPEDISSDTPRPDSWDRFILAYYPFEASGCEKSVMGAQKFFISTGFCGDWASKIWGLDTTCAAKVGNCRSVDPLFEYAPQEDCCTSFIANPNTDIYLRATAYWDLSWLKVYQQKGWPSDA